jgi:Fic family protein
MPEDKSKPIPGSFVPIGSGRESFHPETLPPGRNHDLDGEIQELIADTTYELGRLDEISRTVEVGPVLFTSLVRQEAVESAAIEGADVTTDEVYRYHTATARGDEQGMVERDLQEVLNYEEAVYRGIEAIDDGEGITVDLLHSLHETLLAGSARADTEVVGAFRPCYVHLGSFVPPPAEQLDLLVENLLKYANRDGPYHYLVDLALGHYQFETIHPYEDGNGRLGRLLATVHLYDREVIEKPYLYPSAYFNRHKAEYVERLQNVRHDGNWEDWIAFFLTGIREQARDAYRRAQRLGELRDAYEDRYGTGRTAAERLALELFETPYLTAADVMELLDVSDGTAYNAIEELRRDGVLVEVTGKKRNREYRAAEIFEIIE